MFTRREFLASLAKSLAAATIIPVGGGGEQSLQLILGGLKSDSPEMAAYHLGAMLHRLSISMDPEMINYCMQDLPHYLTTDDFTLSKLNMDWIIWARKFFVNSSYKNLVLENPAQCIDFFCGMNPGMKPQEIEILKNNWGKFSALFHMSEDDLKENLKKSSTEEVVKPKAKTDLAPTRISYRTNITGLDIKAKAKNKANSWIEYASAKRALKSLEF